MKYSNIPGLVLALLLTSPAAAVEFCGKELPEHHTWVNQPIKASAAVGDRAPVPCTRIESPPNGSTYSIDWKCPTFTLVQVSETAESMILRLARSPRQFQVTEDRWLLRDKSGTVFRLEPQQVGSLVHSEACNAAGTSKTLNFERVFSVNGGQPITLRWSYQQLLRRKPVPQL